MTQARQKTGVANGELWGHKASDWATYQESTIAPVFDAVLERTNIGQDTKYLDVGCGAGLAVAKASAKGAIVTGLDASEALIEIARSRLPGAAFHIGDLEDLPFENSRFDVVTSFNAVQYAGNPIQALAETARVTARGGSVAVVTWGEPDGMEAAQIVSALKPLLPPPPPGAPGPFALSHEDTLREFVLAGGMEPLDVFDVDSPWEYPDEAAALAGLSSSGVAAKAIRSAGQVAVDDAHSKAIAPFRKPDGSIEIGANFKVILARPKTV